MDLLLKFLGLVFMVIAIIITLTIKKEVKNHDGRLLQRSASNRWIRRSKASILLMGIGGICTIVGLILSI